MRAISHHSRVMGNFYGLTPDDRVLQFASLSVDTSLEQIFPALIQGAAVVVREEELWLPEAFCRMLTAVRDHRLRSSSGVFERAAA